MKKKPAPPRPCILIDTREQAPFSFGADFDTERATLPTGDYSIREMTELVAIERKSAADLAHCCGHDHDRFMEQMARLESYRHRFLVLELTEAMIWGRCYGTSQIRPQSIMGSLLKVSTVHGTPVIFSANAREAASKVEWIVRRLWQRKLEGKYDEKPE